MIEKRICQEMRAVDLPAEGDKPAQKVIEGYAAMFNSETVLWPGFKERVAPTAFDTSLAGSEEDPAALFNHDPNQVLGRRSNGTLALQKDERGLFYRILVNPNDQQAMDTHAKILRGDVKQSSFAFSVRKQNVVVDAKTGIKTRELLDVRLFDVSPVTYPAYEDTVVQARAAFEADDAESRNKQEQEKQEDSARMKRFGNRQKLADLATKLF